jgi:glycosyltransferase involved in cell wall biosynthesis
MKIAIVIPTLDRGGAERILVHFVNNLDVTQHQVVILCLKKKGDLLSSVNPAVTVVDLDCPRVYFSIGAIKKQLKVHQPDVLIGWMGHVNAVLAFFKPLLPGKLTLMCRESSIPSKFILHYRAPGLFRFMYRFMNRYHGIICQSEAMKEDLVVNFKVRQNKIEVINNPVVPAAAGAVISEQAKAFIGSGTKTLLFVGRFSLEKQVELVVETTRLLPAEYKLVIVGYGPLESQLREQIAATNMSARIMIIDNCTNPTPYYQQADCLLLTSSFEGFPNVLLEANLQGCPVVVYKTKGGAKEIVQTGNGIYIEPEAEGGLERFAASIREVCENTAAYDREKIAASVRDRYEIKKTINQYLAFIGNTIRKTNQPIA